MTFVGWWQHSCSNWYIPAPKPLDKYLLVLLSVFSKKMLPIRLLNFGVILCVPVTLLSVVGIWLDAYCHSPSNVTACSCTYALRNWKRQLVSTLNTIGCAHGFTICIYVCVCVCVCMCVYKQLLVEGLICLHIPSRGAWGERLNMTANAFGSTMASWVASTKRSREDHCKKNMGMRYLQWYTPADRNVYFELMYYELMPGWWKYSCHSLAWHMNPFFFQYQHRWSQHIRQLQSTANDVFARTTFCLVIYFMGHIIHYPLLKS